VEEALVLARATTENNRQIYGPDHPYYYGCIGDLAVLYRVSKDARTARAYDEQALAGLEARVSRNHHYTLTVAANLASDMADLGDTTRAREISEDTLVRLHRVLGGDHPVTLSCAANLIIDRRADGDERGAATLSADTMERCRQALGGDHPGTAAVAEGRRLDLDFDPPQV
jgi:hypothetical protein